MGTKKEILLIFDDQIGRLALKGGSFWGSEFSINQQMFERILLKSRQKSSKDRSTALILTEQVCPV